MNFVSNQASIVYMRSSIEIESLLQPHFYYHSGWKLNVDSITEFETLFAEKIKN